MNTKINVVTEQGSWILKRMAKESIKYWENATISDRIDEKAGINYFMNYALVEPCNTKSIAYFTHLEDPGKWKKAETLADVGVYMAERYKPNMKAYYNPPSGLEIEPRPYRIGLSGRCYKSGRKGDVEAKWLVEQFPFVEWVGLGSGWKGIGIKSIEWQSDEQAKEYYESLDLFLSMATVEGGPLGILEAVKCGTNVLCRDVGNSEIWGALVSFFEAKEGAKEIIQDKINLHVKRNKVRNITWDNFAKKHIEIFKCLLES